MRAAESKLCFRVIEIVCGLPIGAVVALRAVWTKLSFVLVFMAAGTAPAQPQIGVEKVFRWEAGALHPGDVHGIVALGAG